MEVPVPTTPLRITMVSDVVCPWCAVGLHGLLRALATLQAEFDVAQRRWCLDFQPFRLNTTLGPEGAEVVPYLQRKYGMSAEQVAQSQANIRERAAQVSTSTPRRGTRPGTPSMRTGCCMRPACRTALTRTRHAACSWP